MRLTGESIVPLPQERVWVALNDAVVLRQCIPGCENFENSPGFRTGSLRWRVLFSPLIRALTGEMNERAALLRSMPVAAGEFPEVRRHRSNSRGRYWPCGLASRGAIQQLSIFVSNGVN